MMRGGGYIILNTPLPHEKEFYRYRIPTSEFFLECQLFLISEVLPVESYQLGNKLGTGTKSAKKQTRTPHIAFFIQLNIYDCTGARGGAEIGRKKQDGSIKHC